MRIRTDGQGPPPEIEKIDPKNQICTKSSLAILYQNYGTIFFIPFYTFFLFWGLLYESIFFYLSEAQNLLTRFIVTSCFIHRILLQIAKIQSLYRQRQYSQIRRVLARPEYRLKRAWYI